MWMFYAVSSLLSFLVCSVLSIILYFYNRKSVLYKKFLALSFFIGMWSLCAFVVSMSSSAGSALFYGRFFYIFAILTPAVFFTFICAALEINLTTHYKKIFISSICFSCFFFVFSYSDLFIKDFIARAPNVYVVPGILYYFFLIYFISLCLYVFIILRSVLATACKKLPTPSSSMSFI